MQELCGNAVKNGDIPYRLPLAADSYSGLQVLIFDVIFAHT